MDAARNLAIECDQGLGDRAGAAKTSVELLELTTGRKISVQEQERRLLVRDVPSQILDPVAPVFQTSSPVGPFDIGDCRLAGNHTFQAGMIGFRRLAAHIGTPQDY